MPLRPSSDPLHPIEAQTLTCLLASSGGAEGATANTPRMKKALLGALLMVGGITAQIVASRHMPSTRFVGPTAILGGRGCINPCSQITVGQTTYDVVRIGGWPLLIFGAVIVAFALLRELRQG
jgi:hypothetical protein